MFSMRIVTTSQYQATPIPGLDTTTSEFRETGVKRVPVLRIFGSTPAGQKTCMHIHGVFPYLYVPYDGTQPTNRYLRQFAASLDKALNVANRSASANQQHVYKISIVNGIPMYGYHPEEEQFLKIYLYNPNNVRKAADLMLGGAVMNKPFQPHESHIPYALQLFIDYNLYGMNLVNVAALKFRQKKNETTSDNQDRKSSPPSLNVSTGSLHLTSSSSSIPSSLPEDHIWNVENIPSELLLPASVERQSVCELEVDVVAADILNRQELTNSIGANPGLASLWEDERQRCRDAGESSQIEPQPSQERQGVVPSESETELLKQFLAIVKDQQAFRDSQSDQSLLSESQSQPDGQISRQDSHSSSEGTVILDYVNEETAEHNNDEDGRPIISLDSIKKVVSLSQSFSNSASQKDSQDQSVADILASLLEESGPPSSQVTSLEEKDSVLNQSVVRDEEYDEEEDNETLLMSQSLHQTNQDERLGFTALKDGQQQDHKGIAIAMDTDEDDDDYDEIDLLPQFDGASDPIPRAKKTTDPAHNVAQISTQSMSSPENSSQQMPSDPAVMRQDVNQWAGEKPQSQGYSADHSSGFTHPHQGTSNTNMWSGPVPSNWQGQSPMWQQQQQQRLHNWSPQQQPAPGYPQQQQTPYRAASPFHSPPHNSFASPGHIPSQSPSVSQHRSQFQFPAGHAQSPSSNQQQYPGQPYQSPYQSPASSTHSFQQSPQPYQSPTTPGAQGYQYPCKPYPTGGTSYHGSGYQTSPGGQQMYQSPTYHPASSNSGGQMYRSPYQSPHQPYPSPYSSPRYNTPQQPGWSPRRDFQGYFQSGPSQQQSPASCTPGSTSQHTGDHTTAPTSYSNSNSLPAQHDPSCYNQDSTKCVSNSQQLQQLSSPSISQGGAGQNESNIKHLASKVLEEPTNQKSQIKGNDFRFPTSANQQSSESVPTKKQVQSQPASYARALPPPNTGTKSVGIIGEQDGHEKTLVTTANQSNVEHSPLSSPSSKISTLDFKPGSNKTDTNNCGSLEKTEEKPAGVDASATPMIQQLLMEESPARKNIKPKDRLAAANSGIRKPMPSPSPPKPKKKSKIKASPQEGKLPGRPRSSSTSSPANCVNMVDFRGGYSPQPPTMTGQRPLQGKSGRSQSISLPFNNEAGMVRSPQTYAWNNSSPSHPQPQQLPWGQSYPGWQQQQHHHHHQAQTPQHQQTPPSWGNTQWQNYPNTPATYGNGGIVKESPDHQNFRMQNRSFSADAAFSSSYSSSMSSRHPSQSDSQSSEQENSVNTQRPQGNSGEANGDLAKTSKDPSSISSLLQLVSDVGSSSDETGWDSVVTSLSKSQPNGNIDMNHKKSPPTSECPSQPSPSVKDFITLETPTRHGVKSNGSCVSSEESGQLEDESSIENSVSSKVHPRLGKQNRLKRMGPKLSGTDDVNSGDNSGGRDARPNQPKCSDSGLPDTSPNPWYTYTFHVPTPVFKKLKFYQSAKARRQTVKIVRMHPMDARRYSLLKIGREVVRVARLTPQELARYNVTFPPPSRYISPDGSSNRVNLDIPTSSGDSHNGDGSAEEGGISFDTDFPPNKVAPPSSFDSSHVTASVQRSVAQPNNRGSPRSGSPGAASAGGSGDWGRQSEQQQQQYGFMGYASPSRASNNLYPAVRPPQAFNQQFPDQGLPSYSAQQPMHSAHTTVRPFNPGPVGFPMYGGQKPNPNPSLPPSTSGLHNNVSYHSNYQGSYMNNSSYPYHPPYHQHQQHQFSQSYQQPHQQQGQYHMQHQHHHHQQQQRSFPSMSPTDPSDSNTEQKNALRSPGQHGLVRNIDSEGPQDRSGALSVNSWVNAHSNHADQTANDTPFYQDHITSPQHNTEDHRGPRNKAAMFTNDAYGCKKKKTRRKKRGSLSLTKPKKDLDGLEVCDSFDGSVNSDTDKEAPLSHFNQHNTETHGESPTKIVLKNVKSLRLKIPRPYSECTNNHGSLDLVGQEERDSVLDSHEQLLDVSDSKTQDTGLPEESQKMNQTKSRISQHGCRKAKLRSIYSQRPEKKRKKRKKKPEPLKEGVHYIIIGKFKGYKSMLVKIKRVPVMPGEMVSAEDFSQISAREIVRQVEIAPVEELPSRSSRQGKNGRKFRSAFAKSLLKSVQSGCEVEPFITNGYPKNGQAGLMRVEAMTKNNTNILSDEKFFSQVREAFLLQSQLQNTSQGSPLVKVKVFEGISLFQLSQFKKKLLSNWMTTRNENYSSSSDEEEDILDAELLHHKLYPIKSEEHHDESMCSSKASKNLKEFEENQKDNLLSRKIESYCLDEIYSLKPFPNRICHTEISAYPLHSFVRDDSMTDTSKVIPTSKSSDREDFLQRQMAFFEDISSTSESECDAKNELKKSQVSPKCPPLRLCVSSNGIKIVSSADDGQGPRSELLAGPTECSNKNECDKTARDEEIHTRGNQFSASSGIKEIKDTSADKMNSSNSSTPLENSSEDKASPKSNIDDCEKQLVKECVPEINMTNISDSVVCLNNKTSLDSCEDTENSHVENTMLYRTNKNDSAEAQAGSATSDSLSTSKTKKHGKSRKRSSLFKNKPASRSMQPASKESSSNDEANAEEDKISGFEKKRLRQRKQTSYRFYSEDLDSSEDEIWGIEEFGSSKALSVLTSETKNKKLCPSGKSSGPSSSRRKRGAGGDKLLNSLSLLHMATIANLTDAQQDSLDGSQTTSREATSTPPEQYSDKANGDHCPEYTPSLETLSFISPKTPDEAEVSPPVAVSPMERKLQDQARSSGQNRTSRQLFHSVHRRSHLKPGCNGSSNLGTRPLHISHSLNESASSSPVPSTFHINETAHLEEPSPVNDNCENSVATTSTATVHQLLETKKAQVNCASFSMKDILRLATPDDSMDSDSKDSAALVKPPEPRRAQVKSTSLSMSDILQLTKSSSPVEDSASLHHVLNVEKQEVGQPLNESDHGSDKGKTDTALADAVQQQSPSKSFELGLKKKDDLASHSYDLNLKQSSEKVKCMEQTNCAKFSNKVISTDKQMDQPRVEQTEGRARSPYITKKEVPITENFKADMTSPHSNTLAPLNERKLSPSLRKQDETDGDAQTIGSKCLSSLTSKVSQDSRHKASVSSLSSSKTLGAESMSSSTSRLPEILVTPDDNSKGNKPYQQQLYSQGRELNPLHPLQIPTYPYMSWPPPAHPFPSAPASDSPMLRHPDYWPWLAHPASSSPLNLCTTAHRSPNSYSPITPTSPVSPYYPTQAQFIPNPYSSSFSPPAKKSKPLWYPWLGVESGKSSKPCQLSPSTSDSKTVTRESITQKPCEKQVTNGSKESGRHLTHKHSIAGLLANSPKSVKSNSGATPTSETVSQFLGSVIDTAYSRQHTIQPQDLGRNRSRESLPAQADQVHNTRPNSVPELSATSNDSPHHRTHTMGSTQEKFGASQRQFFTQLSNHCSRVPSGPFSGVRKGEADRVRTMLENEMVLRDHYGLPLVRPQSGRDNQSLTERLVSQLIKGGERDRGNREPQDGARGRKRAAKTFNRSEGSGTSNTDKSTPGRGNHHDQSRRDDRQHRGGSGKQSEESVSRDKNRDLTIRPVSLPPRRKTVQENLQEVGLNSVQPPVAFCSSQQDLPDKPMEHGGRVLKVESNRTRAIAPFPCSEQLTGLLEWRRKSLARPGPHTQVLVDAGGISALDTNPRLQMLLQPDRCVVVCPARSPPDRAHVVAWLARRMTQISGAAKPDETSKHQESTSHMPTKQKQGDKTVGFPQNDQVVLPTESAISSAPATGRNKPEERDVEMSSPIPSDISLDETSTLMDTDLDISCTPSQTPRPVLTQYDKSQILKTPCASSTTQKSSAAGTSQSRDVGPSMSKRRQINFSPNETKQEKQSAPQVDVSHVSLTSSDPLQSPVSASVLATNQPECCEAGDQVTPLLKRVSTHTENLLRKNVLSSQTQRQCSELGFSAAEVSQIEGPTPKNTFGFKFTQHQIQGAKARHKFQNITTLSLEAHVETRGELRPDPELDPIQAVFYSVLDDVPAERGKRSITGIIIVSADSWASVASRPQTSKPPKIDQDPDCSSHPKDGDHTPPSSPKPVASQSPSPKPKKGGKGKGRGQGGRASGLSPVRPASSSSSGGLPQALLEKCAVERDLEVTYVQDEMHLLGTVIDMVTRFDPDILVGYEIQMLSWGFLLQRAAHLGLDLCSEIARVQDSKENNQFSAAKDEWGADHMSEIHVSGRIVLNLWRILRHEVALNVYTFENVAFHILHQRIPLYSFRSLTKWYNHKTHVLRWRVLEHYIARVKGQLEIIDSLNLIGKTSEFARVFGIEFYDVLARGSQIRVESMMLRLAKPLNYVPVSPSVNQRARQRAMECIPLTLEPESQLYSSPVVVLDFQSLYPSIMIAYNYCFSTCLGRLSCLENAHEGPFEFGCTSLKVTPATLKKLQKHVTVSPNGVVFLKSHVRRGVLPRMVEEILNTRIMVKKSMKAVKDDKTMSRMLDARQLGLKLIANVTYGYTGASFSGRMPCIEVGDSIVRKARESLERAIELVRNTPRWGAHVVYGDTDSLFIHFPGRSKNEAFVLGHEIADAVTAMFPSPMKLKFEKVYLPCVLQTKKRYVGFMYETPDQLEPVFDAKGIETVRRDSCSAVSKILERSVKLMFSTHDLSRVRAYVTRQLHKLLEGKVSVLDLIFAKEFRGSLGYKPGACVPALEIARKRLRVDRRWEPRVGERVPYIIVHGPPGLPLIQLVREPHDLTVDSALRLNATYYITKQILPPLDRFFSLIGVNVFKWYQDMPKVVRLSPMMGVAPSVKQGTISQFFATTDCPVCEEQTKKPVCEKCAGNPQLVTWTVMSRLRAWERTYSRLMQVCVTCQGTQDAGDQTCISTDCPVMFRRIIARQDLARADNLRDVLKKYLSF